MKARSSFRPIDLRTWPRRQHFEYFQNFAQPTFAITTQLDVTKRFEIEREKKNLTPFLVQAISKAVNSVPELKQRIRGSDVIEWDQVNPSITVLTEGDLFNFCVIPYDEDSKRFSESCRKAINEAKRRPNLVDQSETGDNVVFMTSIPWVNFTNMLHPIAQNPPDSIPRIAWGKCTKNKDGTVEMPVNLQAHHALVDAIHMSRFFERLQRELHR